MKALKKLVFEVAGISMVVKGKKYLNTRQPNEIHSVGLFINKGKFRMPSKVYSITMEELDCDKPQKTAAASLALKEKLRALFTQNPDLFDMSFKGFQRNLYPRLAGKRIEGMAIEELLLEDDSLRIIINSGSLMVFNRQLKSITIYYYTRRNISPDGRVFPTKLPRLLSILRLVTRAILDSEGTGALFHASSIAQDGWGYLFLGQSGSGKSTIVKMIEPERILSDDTVLINKYSGKYAVYATPWDTTGTISKLYAPVCLKALFFIERASKTALKKLSYKEALTKLVYGDRLFMERGLFDNKIGKANFYHFCHDLIFSMPFYTLYVKKSKKFKEEFNNLMRRVEYSKN